MENGCMSNYFDNFPKTQYQKHTATDISRRVKFVDHYDNYEEIILPYTVEENQKPEDVSYLYYGTVDYTWLVCLINDVIDPYSDWVLPSHLFEKMLISKYADQSDEKGYDVIAWTMNTTLLDNIAHFEKNGIIYSKETIFVDYVDPSEYFKINGTKAQQQDLTSKTVFGDFEAVRIYEYEEAANESKRSIMLIDKAVVKKVVRDFKDIIRK